MGVEQPLGELDDLGLAAGLRQGLDVAGAVDELVLELQVLQQRLGQRLGLLDGGLDGGADPADGRRHDVGDAAQRAQRVTDEAGPLLGVRAVLGQLAAHGLGTGLRDAGLCDLGLGLRETEEHSELLDDLVGVRVSHALLVPRASGC